MNGIGPTINGEFFLDHIPDEEETDTTFWKTNEFHKVKGFFFKYSWNFQIGDKIC